MSSRALKDLLYRETVRFGAVHSLPPLRLLSLLFGYQANTSNVFRLESTRMLENAYAFTVNNKIAGDYCEFGVFQGSTFTAAWHGARRWQLSDKRLHAFDSFAGLPEVKDNDAGGPFETGQFAADLATFKKALTVNQVDMQRVTITPGMFDETLNDATKARIQLTRVNMAFIDCDLYASTVPVLDFLTDVLVDGALLMFDDWHCFAGKPDRGEQLAVAEWLARNPGLRLHKYRAFHWGGESFIVDRR
jgi:O-methyltransferase